MFSLCSNFPKPAASTIGFKSKTFLHNRNLIILSTELVDSYAILCKAKLSSTDIIIIPKTEVKSTLSTKLSNYVWDNIAIFFHGQRDVETNAISIFARKMTTNIDIIKQDPGYLEGLQMLGILRQHMKNELHIFASDIGGADGFKFLLSEADKLFNFKGGISVSTDITGNNDEGGDDWLLEWNTKTGYIFDESAAISPVLQYLGNVEGLDFTLKPKSKKAAKQEDQKDDDEDQEDDDEDEDGLE